MEHASQVVDLSFRICGGTISADHGYPLYAAISRIIPEIHGDVAAGIHPIRGQLVGGRRLALTRQSQLIFRVPATNIAEFIRLAGKRLTVDGEQVAVGVPTVKPLRPAPHLISRLVVIRGFMDTETFLDAARRQMDEAGVSGTPAVVPHRWPGALEGRRGSTAAVVRRTLRIRGKEVVGFAVRVDELASSDSLRLQAVGLGGRRRFGCGIFVPTVDGAR